MKNIILIGMPACGKSKRAGVILAKTAAMSFEDTDLLLQEKEGLGEPAVFSSTIREMDRISEDRGEDSVICQRGERRDFYGRRDAVYSERAMAHLKSVGTVVYLKLSLSEIDRRLKNIKTRGIAMGPGETLADLMITGFRCMRDMRISPSTRKG